MTSNILRIAILLLLLCSMATAKTCYKTFFDHYVRTGGESRNLYTDFTNLEKWLSLNPIQITNVIYEDLGMISFTQYRKLHVFYDCPTS